MWSSAEIHDIANRMAARAARGFRVSPLTAQLVVLALRSYANRQEAEFSKQGQPMMITIWGPRGELVKELAVCHDIDAAPGAFLGGIHGHPREQITLSQAGRIVRAHGREPLIPHAERAWSAALEQLYATPALPARAPEFVGPIGDRGS